MLPITPTKVLIIDDCEIDRYTYRRYLEKPTFQYKVFEAKDTKSGFALVEEHNPDCILLDLRLSGNESGFIVLQALLGDHRPVKRAVIVLTVLSSQVYRSGALSLGAADFLVKGETDGTSLRAAIEHAVGHA
jgi:DNA-binding NarL/FixJ family response regulator